MNTKKRHQRGQALRMNSHSGKRARRCLERLRGKAGGTTELLLSGCEAGGFVQAMMQPIYEAAAQPDPDYRAMLKLVRVFREANQVLLDSGKALLRHQ